MTPAINRFLLEGAEFLKQENNCVDRLMKYLDDNLLTLHSHLNTDNFNRILSIIWENLSHTMYDLVESNLEVSLRLVKIFYFLHMPGVDHLC
jgi:hypothetical protein